MTLNHALIAIICGLLAGVGVASPLFIFPTFASKDNPYQSIIWGYAGFFVSSAAGAIALYLYYYFVKTTFVWFGVSLTGGFFIALFGYFVQNIDKLSNGKK